MTEQFNVLITCFKRTNNLEKLIRSVLDNTNSKIFIHQDAGTLTSNEEIQINKVYSILKKFESKRVVIHKQNVNLGCYRAVKFAVDWAMTQSKYLLVLEDDLILDKKSFDFLRKNIHMLSLSNVATISLYRDAIESDETVNGIQVSPFFSSWGWATSAEKWLVFKDQISLFSILQIIIRTWREFGYQPAYKFLVTYRNLTNERLDSWAYRWFFTILEKKMINVYPPYNFVVNIGFNEHPIYIYIDAN